MYALGTGGRRDRNRARSRERICLCPGQYIELNIPRTEHWRAYSRANRAGENLELLVKLFLGGLFSEYLRAAKLKRGDVLSIRGPYGSFTIREHQQPILLVAGGSGLAPVLAMLRALANERCSRTIRVLYGARTSRNLCFVDELLGYERNFPDLRFIPVLSEAAADNDWRGETGMVTEVIGRYADASFAAYMCGPPVMIDAALPILDRLGVSADAIFFDKFLTRADLAQ